MITMLFCLILSLFLIISILCIHFNTNCILLLSTGLPLMHSHSPLSTSGYICVMSACEIYAKHFNHASNMACLFFLSSYFILYTFPNASDAPEFRFSCWPLLLYSSFFPIRWSTENEKLKGKNKNAKTETISLIDAWNNLFIHVYYALFTFLLVNDCRLQLRLVHYVYNKLFTIQMQFSE